MVAERPTRAARSSSGGMPTTAKLWQRADERPVRRRYGSIQLRRRTGRFPTGPGGDQLPHRRIRGHGHPLHDRAATELTRRHARQRHPRPVPGGVESSAGALLPAGRDVQPGRCVANLGRRCGTGDVIPGRGIGGDTGRQSHCRGLWRRSEGHCNSWRSRSAICSAGTSSAGTRQSSRTTGRTPAANCHVLVVRVVRDDDSGTSNILKTYLQSVDPDVRARPATRMPPGRALPPSGVGTTTRGRPTARPSTPGHCSRPSATPDYSAIRAATAPSLPAATRAAHAVGDPWWHRLRRPGHPRAVRGSAAAWTTSVLDRASVQSAIVPSMYINAASIKSANCDFASLSLPKAAPAPAWWVLTFRRRRTPRCRLTPGPWTTRPTTRTPPTRDRDIHLRSSFDLAYSGLSTPPPGRPAVAPPR